MKIIITTLASLLAGSVSPALWAQDHDHDMHHEGMEMPGMMPMDTGADHNNHAPSPNSPMHDSSSHAMVMKGNTPIWATGSGTSRLPGAEGGMHGLHLMPGDGWMLMAHGWVRASYSNYSGPRGDDMAYVTSMAMLSAQKDMGGARFTLKSMMSLEPLMDAKGYPALFATGETAHGQPLVDRQHPHDLFMELAARLDVDVAPGTALFVYGGPVGEPALGPSVFMMRGSARDNPEPPISHHWFDSTHITYGVVTAGISAPHWQLEASAFRGAEPDEERWGIETPKLDSWSVRASWNPAPHWSAQVSHGFLKQPEATHASENEHRTTASVHYADGKLSAMAAFSAKNRDPGSTLTAWLAEAQYDLTPRHGLFARFENVANAELFPDHEDPLHDRAFRISKLEGGYAWNTPIGGGPVYLTLGGSVSGYIKPNALDAVYGQSPWGYTLFTRLSLGR